MEHEFVSAIVPTIGRAESLSRLLESLAAQSRKPDEVIVADGSDDQEIQRVVKHGVWTERGLRVRRIAVQPPNAVRQRCAAIAESSAEYLLLLDDDVVLEPQCLENMLAAIGTSADVVAVTADFNNQSWSGPTILWGWYLRWCCGVTEEQWQGRVIGPLLRFGYNPSPARSMPMEWLGAGNSLVRRIAYDQVGGFSDFFLHRCTMNEDVDLGLKLGRVGRILLCPMARLAHLHAPEGRVPIGVAAEDDLYNRFFVMRYTQRRTVTSAFGLVLLYFLVETASSLGGCLRRLRGNGFGARLGGRLRALFRIVVQQRPPKASV